MKLSYLKRSLRAIGGLSLCALGTHLSVIADTGLAPWEAFSYALSGYIGLPFGTTMLIVSAMIVLIDVLLKEKIGLGTLYDAVVVGLLIDVFAWLLPFEKLSSLWLGLPLLLLGAATIAMGVCLYMREGLGCGPRDALMVALGRRMKKVPVGMARIIVEGMVLLVGWFMRAPIGIGTIVAWVSIGLFVDLFSRLLHTDLKAVAHESILTSMRQLFPGKKGLPASHPPAADACPKGADETPADET